MSVRGSEAEREFFLTGAKLYLEVEDSLAEFRREVQDKCARVVKLRLADIGQACQVDWTSEAIGDYRYRCPEGGDVGRQLAVQNLGRLYFCLALYREGGRVVYAAAVYLWRQNANLAGELWSRLEDSPAAGGYREGNSLLFEREIPENGIPEFETYLNGAIDDFISFISGSGGLKKYI